MEVIKVEGIVIKDIAYGETSKILTLLTKDMGKISVMSKGCRGMKSKLRGVSGKLTYGYFYLAYKKNGLSTLTAVDILHPLSNILMDIEKISYASYLLELTDQIMKESAIEEAFQLLSTALIKINDGLNPLIITNILELKYLDFLGVAPVLNGCVVCGNTKNVQTVSIAAGGYLCASCYQSGKIYSEAFIQLLRMYYLVDLEKITKLDIRDDLQKEINRFIDEYYGEYTGLYLNSKKFLQNLAKIG